jgi:two-component system response regulator (stage 0 sporulation protein F)
MPVSAAEKKILIVDDDETLCLFLQTVLSNDGFATEIAFNGEEAVRAVNAHHVDLLILDWRMPILSGFEVLRRLQSGAHKNLPVIVITSCTADEVTKDTIKHQMNISGFMNKPIDHRIFIRRVHEILGTVPLSL